MPKWMRKRRQEDIHGTAHDTGSPKKQCNNDPGIQRDKYAHCHLTLPERKKNLSLNSMNGIVGRRKKNSAFPGFAT